MIEKIIYLYEDSILYTITYNFKCWSKHLDNYDCLNFIEKMGQQYCKSNNNVWILLVDH